MEKQEEQQKPDQDITLMLHEWVKPESGHSMAGMDHSTMSSHDMSNIDHMTINNGTFKFCKGN